MENRQSADEIRGASRNREGSMTRAQVIHEPGPPEVMRWEPWDVPPPGPGEVRLRHTAIGVNFADTHHRRGLPHPIRVPPHPCVIGFEAAGVVEALGEGVSEFAEGDRVAYALPPLGAYAEARIIAAKRLVRLPDDIEEKTAAATLMKGLTAQFLLHRTYAVKPGDPILVHAAAGALGQILCRWASHIGATVIGTVSTPEKAQVARAAGCHHAIVRSEQDFAEAAREITGGKGVAVVYEAIGKDTLQKSLDALRPLGMCAVYGNASGLPDPIDVVRDLGPRGSLSVCRPGYISYIAGREDMVTAAGVVFDALRQGIIAPGIAREYPLSEAVEAHRALESGKTTGASVLVV